MGCRIAFFQLFEHLFLSRPQDRDQQRRIVQDQRAGHRDTELMGFGMLGNGVITAVRQQRQGIRKNGRSMRITSDTQDDAIKIGQLPVPGQILFHDTRITHRFRTRFHFSMNAVHMTDGYMQRLEQKLVCMSIITVRVSWRNTSFIDPKETDRIPVDLILIFIHPKYNRQNEKYEFSKRKVQEETFEYSLNEVRTFLFHSVILYPFERSHIEFKQDIFTTFN